jgi:dienelactone hydrolase
VIRAAAALAIALAACGDDAAPADDAAGAPDAAPSADARPPDAGSSDGWESVEVTTDDGAIVIERVSYRSEGLLIVGQVCRPAGAGPFPVLISNHGGFSGLVGDWNGGSCADGARNGFVVVMSSYRGEDGSEGEVEVCLGEVTDVLVMTDIALAQPYADADRVLMLGGSHGGCITLRAVQRGAPVHGAVDIFGPTDLATNYAFWVDQVAAGGPYVAFQQMLIDLLEDVTGGTPAQVPDAYAARSPLAFADDLPAGVPVMMVHGVIDPLVPPGQSCALAAAVAGVQSFHLDGAQLETTTAPAGCESSGVTWLAGPRPQPGWPGSRYLVVYDGVGHDFNGAGGMTMVTDSLSFLAAKLPP